MRQNREAAVGFQVVRGLVVLLYLAGSEALLFACLGYIFALAHNGATAGFVLQLSANALWLALGLLLMAVFLDMIFRVDDGRGRR